MKLVLHVSRDTSRKQKSGGGIGAGGGICSTCGAASVAGQRWCSACHAKYMRVWRLKHPPSVAQRLRDAARSYLAVYLKRGKIIRPETCEMADRTCRGPIEAHHDDYSKPLIVRWVCRSHRVRLGKVSRVYG